MKTMPKYVVKSVLCAALFTIHYSLLTSCSDFFDTDPDNIILEED